MGDISKLNVGGTLYDIKDAKARTDVSDLKEDFNFITIGNRTFTDIIQGGSTATGDVDYTTIRIRTKGLIYLRKGQSFEFTPGTVVTNAYYLLLDETKTKYYESNWIATNFTDTMSRDSYVVVVFKNSSNTSLNPSSYDATIELSGGKYALESDLQTAGFTADDVPLFNWQIGNLNPGGAIGNSTTSLRLTMPFFFKTGTEIKLNTSGYRFNIARYTGQSTAGYISDSYFSYGYGETAIVPEDSFVMVSIWHTNDSPFQDTSESVVLDIFRKVPIEESTTLYKSEVSTFRKPCYYAPLSAKYYNGQQTSYDNTTFNYNTTYPTLIDAYDSIMASNQSYMSKTDLGISSDGTSHLYKYKLLPATDSLLLNSRREKTLPHILIISGQHGFEKASVYGLYYFIKDLTEKWINDDFLFWLRSNCVISFIPCVNPYGFNNNTYTNANQVNLNRNWNRPGFIWNGSIGDVSYGGTEPFSEPETRMVRDFILNETNPIILIDFHTQGGSAKASAWNKVVWVDLPYRTDDPYYLRYVQASSALINTLTYGFKRDYNVPTGETLVGEATNFETGYGIDYPGVDGWCTVRGIIGHTLEGSAGFPTDSNAYTPNCLKYNSEILGNWIMTIIDSCAQMEL